LEPALSIRETSESPDQPTHGFILIADGSRTRARDSTTAEVEVVAEGGEASSSRIIDHASAANDARSNVMIATSMARATPSGVQSPP
jgi:hypothetical protein